MSRIYDNPVLEDSLYFESRGQGMFTRHRRRDATQATPMLQDIPAVGFMEIGWRIKKKESIGIKGFCGDNRAGEMAEQPWPTSWFLLS